MVLTAVWIIWLSLTPLVDRDGTRFHLPFAKLWAENGFMFFRRYFAYYDLNMFNLNYLYMLVFKFGFSDQFTKIIHASFLLAGGYLVFRYFREKYGFSWGAISFLMYATIPVHQRLAAEVYVDLGLLFFSTLSIIYFIKWFESDFCSKKYLVISAIGTGLAFGTKYNAMIFAFFITIFIGFMVAKEKKDDKLAVKSMAIYSIIILLCATPWLLRNFINSGNPFFPLFNSIISSDIKMPADLIENVGGEVINRVVNGQENVFSLFMLPVRVFFEGTDHDFLKFDGVLNPFLLLLLPFLFWPKPIDHKKILYYILALGIIVYLVTLYGNNIRIRYFIPVVPILVILNIEALKNLYCNRKLRNVSYFLFSGFMIYNINYSVFFSGEVHLKDFNPFSPSSKEKYIEKYLRLNDFFKFINANTSENSVIYEAFTGGRSYYINRTFYSDTTSLDRYLLELAKKGSGEQDYREFFNNLPNSTLSATHILIRPNDFIKTFIEIYRTPEDPDDMINKQKLQGFVSYMYSLKLLKEKDGVFLLEIPEPHSGL